ncbi:redoxin domain-containing protein [Spirosoma pomorum]
MKKLLVLLLLTVQHGLAQPKNGQPVADFLIPTLLNAPTKTTTLAAQRGKVVLLEFWATWCSPCLKAMPHLAALQKRHANQLQVIAITDESAKRIGQYLTARPSNLWVAIDSAHTIASLFPHHIIPHTVLIGPDGTLVAQATPDIVTDGLIDSLWRKQTVHLAEKIDNSMSLPDILKTYFGAADTVRNRFVMQAQIEGAPSFSTTHLRDSVFKNRRITCLNLPLTALYRIAYGNYSYKRTVDETGSTDKSPVYCVDLIVDRPEQLLPVLRAELASRFDIRTSIEPQRKQVNVLRVTDQAKFDQIPRNKSGQRTYSARQGEMDQQAVTMQDVAEFLESYGIDRRLVIDETQNREKMDVTISYQPENPSSLTTALSAMGLSLVPQERQIDMLVLRK